MPDTLPHGRPLYRALFVHGEAALPLAEPRSRSCGRGEPAQLTAALQAILDAGIAAGTLRADVRAEDIVATIVGMFAATSRAGGNEQLQRMLDLLMDAIRRT
jgi:hypothetical protein